MSDNPFRRSPVRQLIDEWNAQPRRAIQLPAFDEISTAAPSSPVAQPQPKAPDFEALQRQLDAQEPGRYRVLSLEEAQAMQQQGRLPQIGEIDTAPNFSEIEQVGQEIASLPEPEQEKIAVSFWERLPQAAKSGWENMARSLGVTHAVLSDDFSPQTIDLLADSIREQIEQAEIEEQRQHPSERELKDAIKEFGDTEGFVDTTVGLAKLLGTVFVNPKGLAIGTTEQFANMLPSLTGGIAGAGAGAGTGAAVGSVIPGAGTAAGGAVGALWGSRAGFAAGTAAVEYGFEITEAITSRLAQEGKEPTRENIAELLSDPGIQGEIKAQAAKKGLTLAAVDAVFMGLAGKLGARAVSQPTRAGKARYGAAAVGVEFAGEPTAEAASQLVARGEIDKADVAAEGIYGAGAAIGGAAAGTASQALYDRARGGKEGKFAREFGRAVDETQFIDNTEEIARQAFDPSRAQYGMAPSNIMSESPGQVIPEPQGPIGRSMKNAIEGNPQLMQEAQALAAETAGTRVTARTPYGEITGTVESISPDGTARIVSDDDMVYEFGPQDGVELRPIQGAAPVESEQESQQVEIAREPESVQAAGTQPAPPEESDHIVRNDGTPFPSYEQADRAMKNRRLQGYKAVQLDDGGWALRPTGQAPVEVVTQDDSTGARSETRIESTDQQAAMGLADRIAETQRQAAEDRARIRGESVEGQEDSDDPASAQVNLPDVTVSDTEGYRQRTIQDRTEQSGAAPDTTGLEFKRDGSPFASRQQAERAAKNRRLEGYEPIAVEGGFALAPVVAQEAQTDGSEAAPQPGEASDQQEIRRGEVGGKLSAGERVLTASGRETTPFPKIDTSNDRKASNTLKRVDQWLMDNAIAEARSRGDEFNARQFEASRERPSQADKDSAEEYLFGEQPAVVRSSLKPMSKVPAAASPAAAPTGSVSEPAGQKATPSKRQTAKQKADAARQRARDTIGAAEGDVVTPSADIGYSRAGESYRVTSIGADGSIDVENVATGSRTQWSRSDLAAATRRGVEFARQEAAKGAEDAPAAEQAGQESASSKPKVSENKIFTEDAAERARQILRSKLSQINTGLDPEAMQAGIVLAGYHLEKGARTFAAYARAMLGDMGEMVRPYLKSWYLAAKFDPRAASFADDMDSAAAVESFALDRLDDGDTATAEQQESRDAGQQHEVEDLQVVEVPVSELRLSEDVPQFKQGADSQGVVEPLEGEFDRRGLAPLQVWRRLDGRLEVISGRHRLDLARRTGQVTVPVQIHDEASGFTRTNAAILDAELNIRDGQGKVIDYVDFFREGRYTREQAREKGLLARALGRRGYGIADSGGDTLIAALRAGRISETEAEAIANAAPRNERLQALGVDQIAKGANAQRAVATMQAVQAMGVPTDGDSTGDLFGFDDSAIREAEQMAAAVAKKQREISERLSAISGAARRPEVARREGIDVRNPEAVRQRIGELRAERDAWDRWHTDPEKIAQIREELGLSAVEPFTLEAQTEEEIREAERREEQRQREQAERERQADLRERADRDRDDFVLTGSDHQSDILAAYGQGDIFARQPPQEARDVPGTSQDLERDSGQREAGEPVVPETDADERRADTASAGQSGAGAGRSRGSGQRDRGVSGDSAVTGREQSNQPVHQPDGQFEPTGSAAGSAERDGGRGDSEPGSAVEQERSADIADHAQAPRTGDFSERLAAQRAAKNAPTVWGDPLSIDEALPLLLPEQRQDVLKAEQRFDNHTGMLFTNGTGTGKTFTGLGIAKRFYNDGKRNIVVVVPSDKIASDWVKSAGYLDLPLKQLESTVDNGGSGPIVTTYANFGQNPTLADRNWDLVITDESHYLMSSEDGKVTRALDMLRALTGHPDGFYPWLQSKHRDLYQQLLAARESLSDANKNQDIPMDEYVRRDSRFNELNEKWREITDRERPVWEQRWTEQRDLPRVTFLSATPFAYVRNVEYAEGYLFHFTPPDQRYKPDSRGQRYNEGDAREQFYMTNFGYRMRYNKLTQPDAGVNTEVMEQQFNERLKNEGALSGRRLDVPFDYQRRFLLIEDAAGHKIDDGLKWLREAGDGRYMPLYDEVMSRFDYHQRMFLLEAIKAKHAVPHIKKHLGLGRKVVVFHDFNKGGGFHPFKIERRPGFEIGYSMGGKHVTARWDDLVQDFENRRPDLVGLNMSDLHSPIVTLQRAFPDALFFNGTISKGERRKNADLFNDDSSGRNLIVVQSDAGREGVSLHDTTSKHPRVIVNLGMPTKPVAATQIEGRIYRTGQASNAIFDYMTTGTAWEAFAFGSKIAERSSTAENLALGSEARGLKRAFIDAYQNAEFYEPNESDGAGGKEYDRTMGAAAPISEFERAKTYYYAQQKNQRRRDQREGVDYYATPEPVGFKMVEWAGVRENDSVLEPSAGHGAIARFVPDTARLTMVEPSYDLSQRAALARGDARIVNGRFEDLALQNKYDAIVMNPPYGKGGKTAVDHLAKAAKHLREGGRIVALLPRGGMADQRLNNFLKSDDAKNLYMVAEVLLPPSTFERAGTKVNTKVVVLERHDNAETAASLEQHNIDLSNAESVAELFDRIENIELPERAEVVEPEPQFEIIEHVTKKGKTLRGIIRTDLTQEQAEEIDPYTFRKRNAAGETGWFIREKHLEDMKYSVGAGSAGTNSAAILDELRRSPLAGAIDKLVNDNRIVLHDTVQNLAPGAPIGAQAATDGNGIIHLFADSLPRESATPVLLHEAFHGPVKPFIGSDKWNALNKRLGALYRQAQRSEGRMNTFWREAAARVENAERMGQRMTDARRIEEFGGYAIENYESAPKSIRKWVDDLIGAIKAWLFERFGIQAGQVTPSQLRALAVAALRDASTRPSPFDRRPLGGMALNEAPLSVGGTIDVDGVSRPTTNSNGQPIHPTEEGIRNFWRWFGSSRVVDENGRPLVVYHGTGADFSEFNVRVRDGQNKYYFARDPMVASEYAGGQRDVDFGATPNVMPVYLSVTEPFILDAEGRFWSDIPVSSLPDTMQAQIGVGKNDQDRRVHVSTVANAAAALGHDGVIVRNVRDSAGPYGDQNPTDVFITFRPEQIKSATGNVGTFDPSNPDIRYSVKPSKHFKDLSDEQKSFLDKIGPERLPVRLRDRFNQLSDNLALRVRQAGVDRYAALLRNDQAIHGEDTLEGSIASSAWVLARMSHSAGGAVTAMLEHGRIYLDSKEKIIDVREGTRGLGETLRELGTPQEIDRFMGWIAANRARKLLAEGRENLFTPEEIDAGIKLSSGKTEDGRNRGPLYQKAWKEFQQYRDDVLAIAEQSGIITSEQRETWSNEFYVPFYRVLDDENISGPRTGSGLTRQQAYKRLKGGKQNLNDLLENTLLNFHHLIQASLKNQAAQQAVENAQKLGIAEPTTEAQRDKKLSTFIMVDGEKRWFDINDPLTFKAISALGDAGLNTTAMKIGRAFKRLLTNTVTVTPQFVIANTLRDTLSAMATSPTSAVPFKNAITGAITYGNSRERARMLASGGAFSFGHIYGHNADEIKASLRGTMREARVLRDPALIPGALRHAWRKYNEVTNFAENINRAGIWEHNKDRGKLKAAFEARDLMDFTAHGDAALVRVLIDLVPFLNARIQGLDKLYRSGIKPGAKVLTGKGTKADRKSFARFALVTGALAVLSMALYLRNRDDEEYRKLEDWQRDTYWFLRFGDNAFFIPKPFEVGAIATMAERALEQFADPTVGGEKFVERFGHMLLDTFAMNPIPQAVKPVYEIAVNEEGFTGRPIEDLGMQRLSPSLRSRPNTSRLASGVSRAMEATLDVVGAGDAALSPVQIDHLVRGYLGSVGASTLATADVIWRRAMGEEMPAKRWSEYQPIRRFYRDLTQEPSYTRYGTDFYNTLKEVDRIYANIQHLKKHGELERAVELYGRNEDKLAMRKALNKIQRNLSKLNAEMKRIQADSSLSAEEKRDRLDRLRSMRNTIQERVGKELEARRVKRAEAVQ